MGINGLLPVLKPICDRKSVSSFSGLRVGVDASSWLHKGAFSCALELATGAPTTRYVDYCMYRVRMLLHFGAIPVLVFDGAPLPMKAATNAKRRELRAKAREAGMAALARNDRASAAEQFQRGCEVTHEMARAVIKEVRKLNVEYVVAPYEADAQLAWLSASDDVDVVVTEDSDLVVYGAKKVFYKMNKDGDGDLYQTKNLMALDDPNMRNFTPQMFTWVCVFAGCDFFEGIPGLGIRKAHALVKRYPSIQRTLQVIRFDTKYKVDAGFADHFHRACLVFRHQTVYCRFSKSAKYLNPFDDEARAAVPEHIFKPSPNIPEDLDFIGKLHGDNIAVGVANATRHPVTLVEYSDPLDAVERPVPSARALLRRHTSSHAQPVKKPSGSFQVNIARGRLSATQRPLFQATQAPAIRISSYFLTRQPGLHIGYSAAVSKEFKPPARGTSGAGERVSMAPVLGASQGIKQVPLHTSRTSWANSSLRGLDPGNVGLPSSIKRRTTNRSLGVSCEKRQRTMKEMTQSDVVSKAASRFADSSRKTGTIAVYAQASSTSGSAPQQAGELSTCAVDARAYDAQENGGGLLDELCPASPDSQAYELFEAVDDPAAAGSSSSPVTPVPSTERAEEGKDDDDESPRRPALAASSVREASAPVRHGASEPDWRKDTASMRNRRSEGIASTPTAAMLDHVRSIPRRSPRTRGKPGAQSSIGRTRNSRGVQGGVISRSSL
jgi:exonuclease 1